MFAKVGPLRINKNLLLSVAGTWIKMSGGFIDEKDPNYNFKGWRLYFNSYTKRGRLNVSNMTVFDLLKAGNWIKICFQFKYREICMIYSLLIYLGMSIFIPRMTKL